MITGVGDSFRVECSSYAPIYTKGVSIAFCQYGTVGVAMY